MVELGNEWVVKLYCCISVKLGFCIAVGIHFLLLLVFYNFVIPASVAFICVDLFFLREEDLRIAG